MEMMTADEVRATKALLPEVKAAVAECKRAGAIRVSATIEKSQEGPIVVVHTPFLDNRNVVRSVDEAIEAVRRSEAARAAGVAPRELRVAVD
jgi:hypothetical protein